MSIALIKKEATTVTGILNSDSWHIKVMFFFEMGKKTPSSASIEYSFLLHY
jgi:hypothetical protein